MKNILNKIMLISLTCYLPSSFAQTNDYRVGNTNPFAQYQYHTDSQWESINHPKKIENNTSYFSNSLANPISATNKKYQHLLASSNELNGCWDKAAQTYHVDPWLLMAIAQVESGFKRYAINKNSNSSIDLGMMQINSFWLPTLRKYGIDTRNLFEPCTSVFVGAWIVAQNIKHFGYNQDGIGAYNSPGNITIRRNYAKKVYNSYNQLIKDFHPQLVQN
jgi:soluble lytic murein transglycosylase-like protein